MKTQIKEAVETLAKKAGEEHATSCGAMQYAQAVLNLTQALGTLDAMKIPSE